VSRRHPRLAECKNWNDYVRGQHTLPVQPATDTGTRTYGSTGRYSTTGYAVQYPPTHNGLPCVSNAAGTILFRFTPDWASTDNTTRNLIILRNAANAADCVRIQWFNTTKLFRAQIYGVASEYAVAGAVAHAAGSTHVICLRWGDIGQGAKYDISLDGVNAGGYAKAQTIDFLAASGVRPIAGDAANGYVGPALFSAERKSDAWHASAVAAWMAGPSPATQRRFANGAGDLVVPLAADSLAYVNPVSRDPFLDPGLIVFDGNSIMAGTHNTAGQEPYTLVAAETGITAANYATSGLTTQQMTADAVAQIDSTYRSDKACAIVVPYEIHNDLITNTLDAATATANYWTYCDARQAAGWRVVAMTVLTSGADPEGGEIAAINASIRAGWASHADALADVAADARLTDYTDAVYFHGDNIHLSDAGSAVFAEHIVAAVRTLL
jgi:hypothetical protein